MATITKIEQQKNPKRVNVFIDGDFFCGLLTETAVLFGLKIGKEVDEKMLLEAVYESEVKSAFNKAIDLLSRRMHSSDEIFKKLFAKGFEKSVIEETIKRLCEYGYIDDLQFAQVFVEHNTKYSKRILERKLYEKGVNKNIIHSLLDKFNDESDLELCKNCAEKYIKTHDTSKIGFKQKLYASLVSKGFDLDTIKKTLNLLKFSVEIEE